MELGQESQAGVAAERVAAAAGIVLVTLASAQFLMTLDSSVMNVSIATVANDVGTTVTGIQTAITFYTLVMASLMITGGKLGQILGRKRAFAIGCVIYGCGSLITALAPNLVVLMLGWSIPGYSLEKYRDRLRALYEDASAWPVVTSGHRFLLVASKPG
jgi:MFS family permease